MIIRLKPSHGLFGPCLGSSAWTAWASAQAADSALPVGSASGNEVFLWLGLGCFIVAGFLMLGRTAMGELRRRQRGRALREFRTEPRPRRSGGLLRRLMRREVGPRPIRLVGAAARTRRAELKAQQAVAVLRSELTPHLARMMKDRLVWTLMTQRARLLSVNQANAEKVATLEHRLTAIQLQIRKQAEAYESRISELEKELTEKSTLTRELLKFRVMLARQALDAVRLDRAQSRR